MGGRDCHSDSLGGGGGGLARSLLLSQYVCRQKFPFLPSPPSARLASKRAEEEEEEGGIKMKDKDSYL